MSMLGCGASYSSCATLGRAGSHLQMAGGGGDSFDNLGPSHADMCWGVAANSVQFGEVPGSEIIKIDARLLHSIKTREPTIACVLLSMYRQGSVRWFDSFWKVTDC